MLLDVWSRLRFTDFDARRFFSSRVRQTRSPRRRVALSGDVFGRFSRSIMTKWAGGGLCAVARRHVNWTQWPLRRRHKGRRVGRAAASQPLRSRHDCLTASQPADCTYRYRCLLPFLGLQQLSLRKSFFSRRKGKVLMNNLTYLCPINRTQRTARKNVAVYWSQKFLVWP